MRTLALAALGLLVLGCQASVSASTSGGSGQAPEPTPAPVAAPTLAADTAAIRADIEFLADDDQMGRAPGTEADQRVQQHIVAGFEAAGLTPGARGADGAPSFLQTFEVVDGVRATTATELSVGATAIEHTVVPFGHATTAAVSAPLVFVGHGIATEGKGTGDYKGLEAKVEGAIVVALGGSPDPHLSPTVTRPQSKVIAARDHGAVGFVLWEPEQSTPYPNHGEANDLQLPVVWVGEAGSAALLAALGRKAGTRPAAAVTRLRPGQRSRKPATLHTPIEPVRLSTANVVGQLQRRPDAPTIVIGAHMDHLGEGTSHSLEPGVVAVHNGADDNASGVGVVMEMARVLGRLPEGAHDYNFVFIAFGAEEMGLLGSKHYVATLEPDQRTAMVAMLNFDMVGRLGDEQGLVVSGTGTAKQWPQLLEAQAEGMELRLTEDGYGASDQTSFYEDGLPVLHFFTGTHSDYHKPSDDIDKINFEGAAQITELALRIAYELAHDATALDFVKVARKAPARGGFRVSLGTIPDYGAQVDGVRLSGVRKGGAAAEAGLQKGDVITKIGDREIHNLDDYMATFAVLSPGEAVPVVVQRGEQAVTLTMTPQKPRRR